VWSFQFSDVKEQSAPGLSSDQPDVTSNEKITMQQGLKPKPLRGVRLFWRSYPMPYALFCNEAKLSKAYPTEADVWKLAQHSGLVVDVVSDEEKPHPRPVLDNDYEIRPCRADPQENPEKNKAEAERDRQLEFQLDS
jgi:hypothetical protein